MSEHSAFRVDSDEGREVVVELFPARMESEEALRMGRGIVGSDSSLILRLTNAEAADLLGLLEAEIGDWRRERDSARRAFERGEGSLSAETRAEYGLEAEDDGYSVDDPKSAGWRERAAESVDLSRKRERES